MLCLYLNDKSADRDMNSSILIKGEKHPGIIIANDNIDCYNEVLDIWTFVRRLTECLSKMIKHFPWEKMWSNQLIPLISGTLLACMRPGCDSQVGNVVIATQQCSKQL